MNALPLQPADQAPKRRRSFVAGTTEPPAATTPSGTDEIPTLTEVVAATTVAAQAAPAPVAPPLIDTAVLSRELEAWLDEELPQHVMRVLDGVTDQLIYRISAHARADLLPRLREALSPPDAGNSAGEQS